MERFLFHTFLALGILIRWFETVYGTLKAFKELKYNSEIDSLIETQIEYIYSYYFELFKLFNNYLTNI